MKRPNLFLRSDMENELRSNDVSGQAVQCLLKESAPKRHQSRVDFARWSAEEYYLSKLNLDRSEISEKILQLAAEAICWSDVIGIGGREGVEGLATERHPAFEFCGKGRKQAKDGPAWSAAIREVCGYVRGRFRVNANGLLTYWRPYRDPLVDAPEVDAPEVELGIDDQMIPLPWIISIAREGLRRSAGLGAWHEGVLFVADKEDLYAWSLCYNEWATAMPRKPDTSSI